MTSRCPAAILQGAPILHSQAFDNFRKIKKINFFVHDSLQPASIHRMLTATERAEVEKRLEAAKKSFQDGKIPTVAQAARDHNVNKGQLRNRLKGIGPRSDRPVNNKRLTDAQELGLCLHIDKMDNIGFPLRFEAIEASTNSILRLARDDPDQAVEPIGETWVERFLKCYPDYHVKVQQSLDILRYRAHKPEVIEAWFKKLLEVCEKYRIHLSDILNMDKTRFRIGCGGKQKVVTRSACSRCYASSSTNRDYVTVIECVSASKRLLPPMVILPGKNLLEVWVTKTDMPGKLTLATSDTGYANDELSFAWLRHFEHHSKEEQVGEYRLLLLDGFGSHCTLEFVQFCEDHKILPFCLPPHTTHFLQPLDVLLFSAYKQAHRNAVYLASLSCCKNFNKLEFLAVLPKIREPAFLPSSIAKSFRRTGIYPLNASIVLEKLRNFCPVTPDPVPCKIHEEQKESAPGMPCSVRALQRLATKIEKEDMSQSTRELVTSYLKGSIGMATSEGLAYEKLAIKTDAHKERAKRQNGTRRTFPSSGLMTVEEALERIEKEKEKEKEREEIATRKEAARKKREENEQRDREEKERQQRERERKREEKEKSEREERERKKREREQRREDRERTERENKDRRRREREEKKRKKEEAAQVGKEHKRRKMGETKASGHSYKNNNTGHVVAEAVGESERQD